MQEEAVGDLAEPRHRLVVVGRQRLVGEVAGGHHQRAGAEAIEQQDVQRRVGQQHAVGCRVGRDGVRQRGGIVAVHDHDRSLRPGQQRLREVAHMREAADRRQVGRHHRQRLRLTVLPRAQATDRRDVVGVAGEVEAAEALDRDDPPRAHELLGGGDRVRALAALALKHEAHARAAARAGDRLGVIAAVGDVGILRAALAAHREHAHRGLRAVVGHALDDREARAAVRAVDERVA